MDRIIDYLPKMKTGSELNSALQVLPSYDKKICNEDSVTRLIALSDLYKIYIPSFMSVEIYSTQKVTRLIQTEGQKRKYVKGVLEITVVVPPVMNIYQRNLSGLMITV